MLKYYRNIILDLFGNSFMVEDLKETKEWQEPQRTSVREDSSTELTYKSSAEVSFKRGLLLFLTIIFIPVVSYASNDRPLISYFTNSLVFQVIYAGGWYSVFITILLIGLCYYSQKFREVFLSIFFAICGIFLLILLYESYHNFRWITDY